jgi:hypothetical protein
VADVAPHADDVVARLTSLIGERRHAERDRAEGERPWSDPVGPADTPAGEQAAGEPADVEQRREHVPPEREGLRRSQPGERDEPGAVTAWRASRMRIDRPPHTLPGRA